MNINAINRIMNLAKFSYNNDEIPVGAVIVKDGRIIGEGVNDRNKCNNIYGHAEINAIIDASKNKNDWRLDDCEMYVTLKPCMMCTGAIMDSRIKTIYYLCDKTNVRFKCDDYINLIKITNNNLQSEYVNLLRLFFENKRKK